MTLSSTIATNKFQPDASLLFPGLAGPGGDLRSELEGNGGFESGVVWRMATREAQQV